MSILENKVAFITGAASGIGAGTARRFSQVGASIVLADVQAEEGQQLCDELLAQGHQAFYVECDVSQPSSVRGAVDAAIERFGRLDIVFANAGINGLNRRFSPFVSCSEETFALDAHFEVHVTHKCFLAQYDRN